MVILRLFKYKLFKFFGFPQAFPMNLTLGLTYKCNSKCKTCNIWKRKNFEKELSLEEFEKIFEKIGKHNLYLLILTGGEPFLHKNLVEIASLAEKYCGPETIVIPTNCILGDLVVDKTREILKHCKKSHITVNVSLDEIGDKHDKIRGVPGNFKKAVATYQKLKQLELQYPNFDVSIHTVISKFNYNNLPEIYNSLNELKPHNYITEIAEERGELSTINSSITPSYEEYSKAIDFLINKIKGKRLNLKQALRLEYYRMVKQLLKEKRQIVPCYAGIASAQIDPTGEVWLCCIRAQTIGNLRDTNYDFMKLWYNEKANRQRKSIRREECYCPLASANYTNLSLNLKTSLKVLFNLLKSNLK